MTRAIRLGAALLGAVCALPLGAQTVSTGGAPVSALPDSARNGVFVLDAFEGTLRAGPRLVEVAPDGTLSFVGGDPAFDPQTAVDARVFAIEAAGDRVVVGLGFSDVTSDADEPPETAAGFAVSDDGGATWTYRFPALDTSSDSVLAIGVNTLEAIPASVPQFAAPLDLGMTAGGDTIYVAGRFAGLRRSVDGGATWSRVVLPPDSLLAFDPRLPTDFVYSPDLRQPLGFVDGDRERPIFPFASTNWVSFSVLVDEAGTVWAGSAGGLNRSVRLEGTDDLGWIRYVDAPLGNRPVGNLIYTLETQPREGRDAVWAVCWNSGEQATTAEEEFGVVVWRGDDADGAAQFETVLLGVRAWDLAFDEARAYVASDDGLHISDDDGATWRIVRTFRDVAGQPFPIRIGGAAGVRAVATTPGILWVGTTDGLLRSRDAGRTWELFRANVTPADPQAEGRDVEVYAYPNPFDPRRGDVRIRLDLAAASDVTVRLFDVGMNLVRTIEAPGRPAGPTEVAWDGLSDGGLRVANGAYVYVVEAEGRARSGRILVLQ